MRSGLRKLRDVPRRCGIRKNRNGHFLRVYMGRPWALRFWCTTVRAGNRQRQQWRCDPRAGSRLHSPSLRCASLGSASKDAGRHKTTSSECELVCQRFDPEVRGDGPGGEGRSGVILQVLHGKTAHLRGVAVSVLIQLVKERLHGRGIT